MHTVRAPFIPQARRFLSKVSHVAFSPLALGAAEYRIRSLQHYGNVSELSRAVESAHESADSADGISHRAVKPGNGLLRFTEAARIADIPRFAAAGARSATTLFH